MERSVLATSVIALLAGILATAAMLPSTGTEAVVESPYTITEQVIAAARGTQQMSPAISGDLVVWAERPGGVGTVDSDVFAMDLKAGRQFAVCRASGQQTRPAVTGKLVVWEDCRSDWRGDIYGYDLEAEREFVVAEGPSAQTSPAVSEGVVVWIDDRQGVPGIYGYDLSASREFPIAAGLGYGVERPRISGNLVVWQVERKNADGTFDWDIHGYDLATKRQFTVASGSSFQRSSDVSGRRIVWSESASGSNESSIRMFDIDAGANSVIARGVGHHQLVAISGDLIVWSVGRDGQGYDIHGYDLRRKVEFPITRAIGNQMSPTIDGNRVAWEDQRSQGVGKYDWDVDVYGALLEDRPGPLVSIIGAPSEVDASIEIIWPQGGVPVAEADSANVGIYLFKPGTLDLVPCQWRPKVQLWAAVNNEVARPVATATMGVRYTANGAIPMWEFNQVDVSAARDPFTKVYFLVTVDGVISHTNVWCHGADARTHLPYQVSPYDIGTGGEKVDARIQVVWPHDVSGRLRPVAEATLVNVGVDVFDRGSRSSVPPDWDGTVRLYRSRNNGIEEMVGVGQKRLVAQNGMVYPRWEFNDVDVGAALDPANKYYFRVAVDGVDTRSNVWCHGADGRTHFPEMHLPTLGCK